MNFYGLIKSTLIDYPNRVASVIFTKGCNLACPYCHNRELIDGSDIEPYTFDDILIHLRKRSHVLSGVVISGGEPLLYADELQQCIDEIHNLGYKIKLDTNGLLYDRLIKMRNIDFIAMDIKTSIDKYHLVCPHFTDYVRQNIINSIDYIMQSGIDYEFRTTVVPGIVDMDDICHICGKIRGAKKYSLAQFRPKNTLDLSYENVIPYGDSFFTQAKQIVEAAGIECELRVGY